MNSVLEGDSLAEIPKPAETPMFFDATTPSTTGGALPEIFSATRHLEGSNFCYADGHVKFQNRSRVYNLNFYPS